jgi:DNA-dependent RNA polymerase auxiliary subunit epsilon
MLMMLIYWAEAYEVHTIKKNTEALVVASTKFGLEVKAAKKTRYMIMSRDQNTEWIHKIHINNISFERAEHLNILGTTPTN